MDWAVDFETSISKDDLQIIRETLEAKVKAESGQYGEAARILWELLVQLRHQKNERWECVTMVHMGMVYRALRWSIAMSLFEDALEFADRLGFERAKVMALTQIGEIKCQWGQFDDSLELFAQALELVDEGELATKRLILLDTVVAYEGLDQLDRCKTLLHEVMEIDKQLAREDLLEREDLEEDLAHLERISRSLTEP